VKKLSDPFLNKKIILFGASKAGKNALGYLNLPIAYFVDNNPKLWEKQLVDIAIFKPEKLLGEDKGKLVILITSMYYQEIAHQLRNMGFGEAKHFFDALKFKQNTDSTIDTIVLDYPIHPQARYGYGKPPHQKILKILEKNRLIYQNNLLSFIPYLQNLKTIPFYPVDNQYNGPYWYNSWLSGMDAISIYSFLAVRKPQNYYEIGSGNSTKFARKAIEDFKLSTQITSIDPQPRNEIDLICNRCIRERLEDTDLSIFDQLESGDILFIDNSHQVFMNSDVTVVFMDIVPNLKPGVLVGFHDIFLPYDYPAVWTNRFYAEQYLLAAWLLAEGNKFRIEMPNCYISGNSELVGLLDSFWDGIAMADSLKEGLAFWIQTI
jgi:hypothetical protein